MLMYDPAVRKRILDAVAAGHSIKRLGKVGLPGYATIWKYARTDAAFKADLAVALTRDLGKKVVSETDIDAAVAAIASGVLLENLARRGFISAKLLEYQRVRCPDIDRRVREALAEARTELSVQARLERLKAELERGSSLIDARDAAGISGSQLWRWRSADPELDREIASLHLIPEFDKPSKALVVKAIADGLHLSAALKLASTCNGTFQRHLKSDPAFAQQVHDALGGYDDISKGVRPSLAKARFDKVLALIPTTKTVGEACKQAGVPHRKFWQLLYWSPTRRSAFDAVQRNMGRRRGGGGHNCKRQKVYQAAELLREGVHLAEACRRVGITHGALNRHRLRDPQLNELIVNAGHSPSTAGRNLLDNSAARAEVVSLLRDGVPIYGLGLRGAPSAATVRIYARRHSDFAATLVEAIRYGGIKRRRHAPERLDAALDAIAAGVKEEHLAERGFTSGKVVYYYRRKDPAFAARYEAAKRMASGEIRYVKPLSPAELVALVSRYLPANLRRDDRQVCENQAWLDAMTGQLTAGNARLMAKKYVADVRPIGSREPYVNENGDLRSSRRA